MPQSQNCVYAMKNNILRALRDLDQEEIPALTTSQIFSRGLDYFANGRVIAFTWHKDNSALGAVIHGSSGNYKITIRLHDDTLAYSCSCPAWTYYDECKHVICTLLTVTHLLNDKVIPGFDGHKLKIQLLDRDQELEAPKPKDTTVIPPHTKPVVAIHGVIDGKKQMVYLHPRTLIDEEEISLEDQFFRYIAKIDTHLSSWLRTKARRAKLIETMFALIGIKDLVIAHELIKEAAHELIHSYHGNVSESEVTNYLNLFYNKFLQHNQIQLIAHNTKFYHITLDYHYLWSPCKILYSLFQQCFVSELGKEPYFAVPTTLFYGTLMTLEKKAVEHNIQLSLGTKRIKTANLDIALDVSDKQSSDWFDLAPHILMHGVPLTDAQRQALFDGSNMIESADSIGIIDGQTREIIQLLASMFLPRGSGTKRNLHQIEQLSRLRILDLIALRKGGVRVKLASQDEELLTGLSNFSSIEKLPIPEKFTGRLREYQKNGYSWLAFLYKHHFGACLADDMGLGKTIQVIAFLAGIAENIIKNRSKIKTPHLIIVPPTLVFNWQQELAKFYPDLRTHAYVGTGRKQTIFENYDVILTTYDTVRLDIQQLKDIMFHCIILDEAQTIKNIQSARTSAMRQLKGIFTISLTGTPLENHIGEYYSIIDIAVPGLLPSYKEFMSAAKKEMADLLIQKMNTFVLRRTKNVILHELPEKVESNIILEMTAKQQKIYATTVLEVKHTIDHAFNVKTGPQANIIALTAILRLRQICISPQLINPASSEDSPKIDYLIDALIEITEERDAALVFSQFTTCLDLVEKALKKADLAYYRIDGSTSMATRKKIVEAFQNNSDSTAILLLSLKTGGVGLNLTRAHYVFHIDPWWNPAVENQASDRAHRIGQKSTVFIMRLIMHHTIEEKIIALKEKKQKLFNSVMENTENKKTALITKNDFDLLLT